MQCSPELHFLCLCLCISFFDRGDIATAVGRMCVTIGGSRLCLSPALSLCLASLYKAASPSCSSCLSEDFELNILTICPSQHAAARQACKQEAQPCSELFRERLYKEACTLSLQSWHPPTACLAPIPVYKNSPGSLTCIIFGLLIKCSHVHTTFEPLTPPNSMRSPTHCLSPTSPMR